MTEAKTMDEKFEVLYRMMGIIQSEVKDVRSDMKEFKDEVKRDILEFKLDVRDFKNNVNRRFEHVDQRQREDHILLMQHQKTLNDLWENRDSIRITYSGYLLGFTAAVASGVSLFAIALYQFLT